VVVPEAAQAVVPEAEEVLGAEVAVLEVGAASAAAAAVVAEAVVSAISAGLNLTSLMARSTG
jgi:hypothetical protein